MPIKILMPALSPTMTQGNLVKWHKKEGDAIKSGQLLAEIETDKATMEVEAVDEGILAKILVLEGTQDVKVNAVIALLAEKGEDVSVVAQTVIADVPQVEATLEPSVTVSDAPVFVSSHSNRIIASPLAKRIAKNNGVDLSQIQGSGPRGRIVKVDVETYKPKSAQVSAGPAYVDQPLSSVRKIIAKRLTESKQNIPHFYLTVTCNVDKLLDFRAQINTALAPVKISVNDIIIKAFAAALAKNKEANVMWMDNALRVYNTVDIAVAVAIDGGLLTPIVQNAQNKSLKEISLEIKELAQRARDGKLKPEEYQGGSMTISNLGMYGIDEFCAIINPPQSGILAIGKATEQAISQNGKIVSASIMTATLSVDHRAIDGAVGAQLICDFKHFVENPLSLLV